MHRIQGFVERFGRSDLTEDLFVVHRNCHADAVVPDLRTTITGDG
jgi:hypothetical protein